MIWLLLPWFILVAAILLFLPVNYSEDEEDDSSSPIPWWIWWL